MRARAVHAGRIYTSETICHTHSVHSPVRTIITCTVICPMKRRSTQHQGEPERKINNHATRTCNKHSKGNLTFITGAAGGGRDPKKDRTGDLQKFYIYVISLKHDICLAALRCPFPRFWPLKCKVPFVVTSDTKACSTPTPTDSNTQY